MEARCEINTFIQSVAAPSVLTASLPHPSSLWQLSAHQFCQKTSARPAGPISHNIPLLAGKLFEYQNFIDSHLLQRLNPDANITLSCSLWLHFH